MAKITYITPDGETIVANADSGNLMQLAVDEGVDGIFGDCGGVCSCATCHVQVAKEWMDRVGAANETEREILELEDNTNERSRLCCQIEVTDELDGLVVNVVGE